MYVSFKGIKISGGQAKWCYRIALLGLAFFLIALAADCAVNYVAHAAIVGLIAFCAAQLCGLLAFFVVVPVLFFALVFMFAPILLVIWGITHEHQVWKTWWFWVATAACVTVAVFIWSWFDTNCRE